MQVPDSDSEDLDMPRSYLHSAASKGDCLAVQTAVDDGEKVDTEDLSKQTALHWAARKGHLRAAVVLVSNKADLDKKTKLGKTALDLAKESSQTDVINFLEDARNIRIGRPRAATSSSSSSGSPKKNALNLSTSTTGSTPTPTPTPTPASASTSTSTSPTRRMFSPTRSRPRGGEGGKVTAQTENQMIEWAKESATVFLAEAKAKKDKETAIREKAEAENSAQKSKESKAAAMIATLQASLLTMKEGFADPLSTPTTTTQTPTLPTTPTTTSSSSSSTPTKKSSSKSFKRTPSSSKTPSSSLNKTPSLRKSATSSTTSIPTSTPKSKTTPTPTSSTPTSSLTSRPTITITSTSKLPSSIARATATTPTVGARDTNTNPNNNNNNRKPILDRQPSGGKILTAIDVANRKLAEDAKKVRRTPSKESLIISANTSPNPSPSESGVEWVKEQNELKAKKRDALKERKQRFTNAKEATEKRARISAEKKAAEEQRLEKIALARKQANDRVKRARSKTTPSSTNTLTSKTPTPTTNNNTPTTNNNTPNNTAIAETGLSYGGPSRNGASRNKEISTSTPKTASRIPSFQATPDSITRRHPHSLTRESRTGSAKTESSVDVMSLEDKYILKMRVMTTDTSVGSSPINRMGTPPRANNNNNNNNNNSSSNNNTNNNSLGNSATPLTSTPRPKSSDQYVTKSFVVQIDSEIEGLGVGVSSSKSVQGVWIKSIVAGSPFAKAGIKQGFRFLSINGVVAETHNAVVTLLKSYNSKGPLHLEMLVPKPPPPGTPDRHQQPHHPPSTVPPHSNSASTSSSSSKSKSKTKTGASNRPNAANLPKKTTTIRPKPHKPSTTTSSRSRSSSTTSTTSTTSKTHRSSSPSNEHGHTITIKINDNNDNNNNRNTEMDTEMEKNPMKEILSMLQSRSVVVRRHSPTASLGVALFSDTGDRFIRVAHMVKGGPFDAAGVKQNDVILTINGDSVLNQQHQDVIFLLKAADATVTLEVAELTEVQAAFAQLAPAALSKEASHSREIPTLPPNATKYTIKRGSEAGLGIALETNSTTGGILKNIAPGGPFGVAGVPAGHIIVQVDNDNLVGGTHQDIVEALKCAGNVFTVVMVPPAPAPNVDLVELQKVHTVTRIPNKGLGIALYSSKRKVGVRISQMNPGGPVALAGIKEGDIVVQIAGKPVVKSSHDEVVDAFRSAPTVFKVITFPGGEFDKATNAFSADDLQDEDTDTPPDRSTFLNFDDMRFDGDITTSHTAKRNNNNSNIDLFSNKVSADHMRSPQYEEDDDRLRSFSGLENSVGFRALKRAQQEALNLRSATQAFQHNFSPEKGASPHRNMNKNTHQSSSEDEPDEDDDEHERVDEDVETEPNDNVNGDDDTDDDELEFVSDQTLLLSPLTPPHNNNNSNNNSSSSSSNSKNKNKNKNNADNGDDDARANVENEVSIQQLQSIYQSEFSPPKPHALSDGSGARVVPGRQTAVI